MTSPTSTHKDLAGYLRCLVYDLYLLGTSVLEMGRTDDHALIEVLKTSARLKLRAIHDFFFRPDASDSIKLTMFDCYNPAKPACSDNPLMRNTWLTLQSIQTYVVHLDKARVSKKYEKGAEKGDVLPHPKYDEGNQAVMRASVKVMRAAKGFVESVLKHKDFPGLNSHGNRYWVGFQEKLFELSEKQRPR